MKIEDFRTIPLSENICQVLKDRIVSGEYPPKTMLFEKKICEEFGVSRTPFREAIKKLSDLKLVEVVPRFGTYVSGVDLQEVKYAYEVRLTLEPLACRFSAERRTSEQLTELEALIEESETLIKNGLPLLSRSKFSMHCHKVVDEAAHNPLLAGELDRLRTVCARVTTSHLREKIPFPAIASQWRSICLAVKSEDGDAAEALMAEYIRAAINHMRNLFFL